VLIVAASVVVGARLLAAADDTVRVWAVATDLGAGDRVTADDLAARRVRFADGADLERYYRAADDLPVDLELTRGVGEGELLPRAAVAPAGESDTLHLRIAVSDEQVPASVDTGSTVHVHVRSGSGGREKAARAGEPVLTGVTVVAAPPASENLAATGNRTIDVAVTEEQAQAYFAALASVDDPLLTVVRAGG
jgi:hypothetical protein